MGFEPGRFGRFRCLVPLQQTTARRRRDIYIRCLDATMRILVSGTFLSSGVEVHSSPDKRLPEALCHITVRQKSGEEPKMLTGNLRGSPFVHGGVHDSDSLFLSTGSRLTFAPNRSI